MHLKNKIKRKAILLVSIGSLFLYGCSKEEAMMIPIHTMETQTENVLQTKEESQIEETVEIEESMETEKKYVFISGAVIKSGVYEITESSRLYEVIKMAGGFADNASADSINQARKVMDGEQIKIPTIQEVENGEVIEEIIPQNNTLEGEASIAVNINTASEAILCTVNGVGANRAKAIIAYRDQHGEFKQIEDIMKVEGIKEGLFAKMKEQITVK